MSAKADEFRARSLQCELQASKINNPQTRSTYEALARGWASLADNLDLRNPKAPPETNEPA
jgi:hypothetical protein